MQILIFLIHYSHSYITSQTFAKISRDSFSAQKRLKFAKLLKNIKSKFEDTAKQAFKIYSSSNQFKRFIIKGNNNSSPLELPHNFSLTYDGMILIRKKHRTNQVLCFFF